MNARCYVPEDFEPLKSFLASVDRDFFPPLSERKGGIDGFLDDWTNHNGRAVVGNNDDSDILIGSVGYWTNQEMSYIKWAAVLPEFRSSFVIVPLFSHLISDKDLLGKPLYARTWLQNGTSQRLMELLGGNAVQDSTEISHLERVIEPSIPGRDSVWYKFPAETIAQYAKR